jgi:hypothetical protein
MCLPVDLIYWQSYDVMESMVISGKTEVSTLKLGIPMPFKVLYNSDMWISDTGASSHSIKNKSGATNKRQCGSASLGHVGKAVKVTRTLGFKGTLPDVNYNEKLNFNLISLTQLLCNGWTITSRNATGIKLINRNGGINTFDIMIPTAHVAIFTCLFV